MPTNEKIIEETQFKSVKETQTVQYEINWFLFDCQSLRKPQAGVLQIDKNPIDLISNSPNGNHF